MNDIVGFLSICVHMSLVHKPEIADYWSTCPILGSTFASSIMPRDKFCMILAVLHVSDTDRYVPRGTPGHDPLTKIRPVYEHMRDRYKPEVVARFNKGSFHLADVMNMLSMEVNDFTLKIVKRQDN